MNIYFQHIIDFIKNYYAALTFIIGIFLGIVFFHAISLKRERNDILDAKKLESYVKGMNYIIEDNTDKAIEELTNTVKSNPELLDTYNSIGILLRKQGEINRALILHMSLLARPNLSKEKKLNIYINIGVDYRKAGLYDRAKEYFKNALAMDPKNNLAKKYLHEVYEDSRDWESALEWYKRFGEDDSIMAHIYAELGKEQLLENNLEESKKNFERAMKKDKKNVDASLYLGDVYLISGNMKKAYDQWEKISILKPEFANLALERIKDKETLKSLIKKLLIDFRDNKYILYFSANRLYEIGEEKKAFSIYKFLMKKGIKTNSMLSKFTTLHNNIDDFIKYYAKLIETKDVKYTCTNCGYSSYILFFRCPKCRAWDTVKVDIV